MPTIICFKASVAPKDPFLQQMQRKHPASLITWTIPTQEEGEVNWSSVKYMSHYIFSDHLCQLA